MWSTVSASTSEKRLHGLCEPNLTSLASSQLTIMQRLMLLPLLASAYHATYTWATTAAVTPASHMAANASIVMASPVNKSKIDRIRRVLVTRYHVSDVGLSGW